MNLEMAAASVSMAAASRIPAAKSASRLHRQDTPVIDYLNHQERSISFLPAVLSLVDSSLSSYQQLGFKNLMVSFGCTGGQHRSGFPRRAIGQTPPRQERPRSSPPPSRTRKTRKRKASNEAATSLKRPFLECGSLAAAFPSPVLPCC